MSKESEWITRKTRIDTKLKGLDPKWKIIKYHKGLQTEKLDGYAVEEYPTASGDADYVLFIKGVLVGVIEAKRVTVDPRNSIQQAKRYSKTVFAGAGTWRGYKVPFLYATNGEQIHFLDIRRESNISRSISNFHTPTALIELLELNVGKGYDWFSNNPINIEKLRPYQENAIKAIEKEIIHGKRSMLVAMATGTGKTFTTVSNIYRLLESKMVKRILFLVDRRALAVQAVNAFYSFETPKGNKFSQEYEIYSQKIQIKDLEEGESFNPNILPKEYLTHPDGSKTYVYISTIQRMAINLFGKQKVDDDDIFQDREKEEDAEKLQIPIHAFDVIVVDECHRGYTAKETSIWRDVLQYFDAIKIGLTATPAIHTLGLFNEVIFRYTTEEAIKDNYLVEYEAVKVTSGVRINGVFLKEGDSIETVDLETGSRQYDELEDEREYNSAEVERKITAPDSNRKIIQEVAKYAQTHEEETGRFPKILIFATNDIPHASHAEQLVEICKEVFGRGDDFVQKITGNKNVDRPLQRIKEFRNREKPKIVITVDMLTTGVDVPKIEFLVFLRPVKSRILWVQMLGRGTRKCDEIKKDHFKIFDCFDGTLINYFKNATDFNVSIQKSTMSISKVIENIYTTKDKDREQYVNTLIKRFNRISNNMSGEAYEMFEKHIPNGDIEKFGQELSTKLKKDFINTMKILRNKDFQELLINYPRAKNNFAISYNTQDTVTSEVMLRAGDEYQKPKDYLEGFMEFVNSNKEQIEALKILFERPKDWNTNLLNELRDKLKANNFDEKRLERAHKLVYNKALADIISMVKHAAKQEEPIYSAEERVNIALNKVMMGKDLSEEQQKWMEYIKQHLIENLTIEEDDFEFAPIFARRGGLRKAKVVFGDELTKLLKEINEAVVA